MKTAATAAAAAVLSSSAFAQNLGASLPDSVGTVAPALKAYVGEILSAQGWNNEALAPRDRSLITVAALIAAGQPEQMSFHLNRAMDNGLSQEEAGGMLSHLAFYTGWPKVFSAMPVAKQVFESRQ